MFHFEKLQIQKSEQIQPEYDDQHTTNAADQILVGDQNLAEKAGRGTERNEDRREPENKQQRVQDDRFLELHPLNR